MTQSNENEPPNVEKFQTAAVVWLLLALVIGAVLLYLSYIKGKKGKKEKNKPALPAAPEPARQVGGVRRPRRMRVQRDASESDDDGDNDGLIDDNDIDALGEDKGDSKIGTKKARKLEIKAEKKAERQAQQEEREDRKQREKLLEAERKKDNERKTIEEAERAEKERLIKEEEERKEYEEYLQIKASFVIEESGEVGIISEEESTSLLQEFIDYIQTSKVVPLEDLAARFNLKTQEAIERLQHLLEIGRITGVMDDRGKFIYISEEELKNVAKFIKQRGRISIAELAESSNALINIEVCKKEKNNMVYVAT